MSFWDSFGDKKHLIAAHRGARSLRAENTMGAFVEALDKSDFVELDVGFSKDGIAVIIHDDTLERTSDVKNFPEFTSPYNVVDYTYKELCALNFGDALHREKIPTLKEVLEFFHSKKFPLNIELKDVSHTSFDKTAVENVIALIQVYHMEDLVMLSSFNHEYLRKAYELSPNIERAALQEGAHPDNLVGYLHSLHVKSYNPSDDSVDKYLIKKLQKAKIATSVFTVNDKKRKEELFSYGVKAIFTDVLD